MGSRPIGTTELHGITQTAMSRGTHFSLADVVGTWVWYLSKPSHAMCRLILLFKVPLVGCRAILYILGILVSVCGCRFRQIAWGRVLPGSLGCVLHGRGDKVLSAWAVMSCAIFFVALRSGTTDAKVSPSSTSKRRVQKQLMCTRRFFCSPHRRHLLPGRATLK